MNSIDTTTPHSIRAIDADGKDLSSLLASDPAALEMLRAMIGGVVPQQAGLQSSPYGESGTKNLSAKIQTLLSQALADESLPSSLAPIMTALQGRLSSGSTQTAGGGLPSHSLGDSFAPETLGLMKQMLSGIDSTASSSAANTNLQEIRQALADALNPPAPNVTEPLKVEPSETPPPQPDVASLGHSILHSLGAHSSAAATHAASHVPSTERVEQVSALMTEMADRVLVTDPLHGQNPEVRISLADNLMPGTDLRVWREDGGQLRVEFDTVSPYWARVLNEASPLLTQRLNERLGQPEQAAVVTVQQQGGQPEDGRSRNRQSPWELAQQALNS